MPGAAAGNQCARPKALIPRHTGGLRPYSEIKAQRQSASRTASFRTVSASVRGRALAAALGRFERGLDMPALRCPLLLQPRVIAR